MTPSNALESNRTGLATFQELHAPIEYYPTTDAVSLFEFDERRPFEKGVSAEVGSGGNRRERFTTVSNSPSWGH